MHILYRWNYDVGWRYIFDPELGGNVLVHIGAICAVFFIFINNVSNSNQLLCVPSVINVPFSIHLFSGLRAHVGSLALANLKKL